MMNFIANLKLWLISKENIASQSLRKIIIIIGVYKHIGGRQVWNQLKKRLSRQQAWAQGYYQQRKPCRKKCSQSSTNQRFSILSKKRLNLALKILLLLQGKQNVPLKTILTRTLNWKKAYVKKGKWIYRRKYKTL